MNAIAYTCPSTFGDAQVFFIVTDSKGCPRAVPSLACMDREHDWDSLTAMQGILLVVKCDLETVAETGGNIADAFTRVIRHLPSVLGFPAVTRHLINLDA